MGSDGWVAARRVWGSGALGGAAGRALALRLSARLRREGYDGDGGAVGHAGEAGDDEVFAGLEAREHLRLEPTLDAQPQLALARSTVRYHEGEVDAAAIDQGGERHERDVCARVAQEADL